MPLTVVQIAGVTTTVGGTNSSVVTPIDDASSLYIFLNSTTTSGSAIATVQVEPTDTGTNWFPLAYNTSGATAITISSSQGILLPTIAFRQLRLASTGAVGNAALSWVVSKQITV